MVKYDAIIQIDPADNVAVALRAIARGEDIRTGDGMLRALEDIAPGHKIALRNVAAGENIVKYGTPVGHATRNIEAGQWVHSHNEATNLDGVLEYTYTPQVPEVKAQQPATFDGYRREDGQVGIRNEIWIVNTVGCVNRTAQRIADEAGRRFAGRTDGIFSFSHPYGCSQLGDDLEATQKALAGLAHNPNAAGVLVLSLGCESNNLGVFRKFLADVPEGRIRYLISQEVEDEVEEGVRLVGELVEYAARFHREPCPVSDLVIGLKCGGSDGFSGITGNPLLGTLADRVTAQGGTAILSEVPEMFGAEQSLMNRCADRGLFDQTVQLINGFKEYYQKHGQVVFENPSPGNKEGGITTLEEKSCGCIRKGGTGPVKGVLQYGDRATGHKGLVLLQAPGNDLVASTAEAVAGAQMVLFTTGRGTPYGGPVPTLKISTNTPLFRRKGNWIDFDAGKLLTTDDAGRVEDDFLHFVLDVASGRKLARTEENGYREIAIFKDGVTL